LAWESAWASSSLEPRLWSLLQSNDGLPAPNAFEAAPALPGLPRTRKPFLLVATVVAQSTISCPAT
jgi:hypothetical protein